MPVALRAFLAILVAITATHAAAPAPLAQDALPITRGFYVPADVPCSEASNATLMLFTGHGFNSSQVACTITDLVEDEDGYSIVEECSEIQSGSTFTDAARVIISDERHLTRTSDYASTSYHFCPQADLPEPWRDNDLSWLDEQP